MIEMTGSLVWIRKNRTEIKPRVHFGVLNIRFVCVLFENGLVYQKAFPNFLSASCEDDLFRISWKPDKRCKRSSKKYVFKENRNGRREVWPTMVKLISLFSAWPKEYNKTSLLTMSKINQKQFLFFCNFIIVLTIRWHCFETLSTFRAWWHLPSFDMICKVVCEIQQDWLQRLRHFLGCERFTMKHTVGPLG